MLKPDVAAAFAAFHGQFARFFGRTETRRRSEQYLRGLLVQQTDRRNAENLAETVGEATPRALQRLLTDAPWATSPATYARPIHSVAAMKTGLAFLGGSATLARFEPGRNSRPFCMAALASSGRPSC